MEDNCPKVFTIQVLEINDLADLKIEGFINNVASLMLSKGMNGASVLLEMNVDSEKGPVKRFNPIYFGGRE